jgi:hypothetical protein
MKWGEHENKEKAEHGGSHMLTQLLRRERWGRVWFKDRWGDSKMAARGRKQKACLLNKILERYWRYTLQEKPPRRGKILTPPHLHPVHSISTSR